MGNHNAGQFSTHGSIKVGVQKLAVGLGEHSAPLPRIRRTVSASDSLAEGWSFSATNSTITNNTASVLVFGAGMALASSEAGTVRQERRIFLGRRVSVVMTSGQAPSIYEAC